jgi:ketosteroid isomerase-like protein
MSEENVEVVRTLVEAFNAGDWDRYFDQLDPDVEWWDRGDEPHERFPGSCPRSPFGPCPSLW